jgi:hypothetical protein
MSVPSLCAIRKEAAETSMRAPTGREEKRVEELPSNVDTGEGSVASTGRKRVRDVGGDREESSSEGLKIALAARSGVEVINTSFQP